MDSDLAAELGVDPAQYVPGSYGCHEALHVAFLAAESVEAWLIDHPAIAARPDWLGLAQKACDTLHDLYQAIGSEHLDAAEDAGVSSVISVTGA